MQKMLDTQETQEDRKPEFNQCSQLLKPEDVRNARLKYKQLLMTHADPFEFMLSMQRDLQIALSHKNPINKDPSDLRTIGEKFEWLRDNKQSFDDEYKEIVDALPGMSQPSKDRSAVWKKWKAKYSDIRARSFKDLTDDDIIELKMELTDSFHFFMNMFFALDMTAEDMFTYYYIKNAENHNRAKNGY